MRSLAPKILLCALGATFVLAGPKEHDPAHADSLTKKMQTLRQRYEEGSREELRFVVSEDEANAFLVYRMTNLLPAGVSSPWIGFEPDVVRAGAQVDLALLRDRVPPSLAEILSGEVPVELRARLRGDQGMGKVELESATLAGIPLPPSFLEELASSYSKNPSLPADVQLNRPFPLPYGIRTARVAQGELRVTQGATVPEVGRENPAAREELAPGS